MAVVPLSGTDVRILSGIPFSSNYRETRYFGGTQDQYNYFSNKKVVHRMEKANFVRIENGHRYAVNAPIDELQNANYMMFQNGSYGNKWFYAFITHLEFENRHTTWVHFEIDVFQTWIHETTFKPSFVKREHRQLWHDDGTPVVNTLDEGLDYGDMYDTVFAKNVLPSGGYKWLVIVCKEKLHGDGIDPSMIGVPQPLTYYIAPFNDAGSSPLIDIADADMSEPQPITEPASLLKNIYEDENAVNNVVSIYITESIGIDIDYKAGGENPDILTIPSLLRGEYVNIVDGAGYCVWVKEFNSFVGENIDVLDNKYGELPSVTESKLYMYPYTVTILDDFKGNRQIFNMEDVQGKNLRLVLKGSLGLSNKISWGVKNYNRHPEAEYNDDRISNETALINDNPTDVPVLNDMLAAFLQGNKNSLEAQKRNAFLQGGAQVAGGAISAFATGGIGAVYGGLTALQGASNVVNTIQDIEAKKADIDNTPANLSSQGSNTAYQYGHNYNGVWVIQKQIKQEYKDKLQQFFNLYGYKTNEVKIPNMRTRKNWNYVETEGCIIHGNFNNEDLNELKQVFDNGITLWHTDDVGNYTLDNGVR